jgi:hypothetical protein
MNSAIKSMETNNDSANLSLSLAYLFAGQTPAGGVNNLSPEPVRPIMLAPHRDLNKQFATSLDRSNGLALNRHREENICNFVHLELAPHSLYLRGGGGWS